MTLGLLLAAGDGLGKGLLLQAGGAAGLIAIIAMILVVPLYVTQRREVKRLLEWRELEPERGDEGAPQPAPAAAATAATATAPATASYPATPRPTGYMSPAERVTADRPALSRITAERAAIQSPSFWRRLLARGPRHPLVLSLIAILAAGVIVAAVGLLSGGLSVNGGGDEGGGGDGFDRAAVPVVVLNASGTPALADRVADDVKAQGFENVRTGVTGSSSQTIVLFDKGQKREAQAVARELGVDVLQPIDRETRAIAPEAAVVVVAGEDRARA